MDIICLKLIQASEGNLDVEWNIVPGHNKARIVWFRDNTKMGVARLRDGLEKYPKENHINYQGCTTIGKMVRFYLIKKGDVRALKEHLLMIGGNESIVVTPKFIQPSYALEIRI